MALLRSQRSDVFSFISGMGLDPVNFKWSVEPSSLNGSAVDVIRYIGTDFYYKFETPDGKHFAVFSPGDETIVEQRWPMTWGGQLNVFGAWCTYVDREVKAPDPWADIQRQSVSFDLSLSENTPALPFTVKEHQQVTKTLGAMESLLLDFAKSNLEAQTSISAEIKKLNIAAESQDRKSWFFAVIGFVASTAVSLSLAPEQTRQLYQVLKDGLRGIIALVG